MPALLLQPLVENAIRHGLEPKVEGGQVTVQARHEGESVILEVHDTGVGKASPSGPNSFGLTQVEDRLATLYGSKGTIKFIATKPYAKSTRVCFPCKNP